MLNLAIDNGLYLIHKQLGSSAAPIPVITEVPTDHIVVIDCSGSMAYELPQIRQQLKNKLAMMLKDSDTVTIIWFSGKHQFGIVVEGVPLRTALDLSGVHRAIDSFLRPVCLTGFVEPLQETEKVIARLTTPGRAINFFFMSDGHDNQWGKADILAATEKLQPLVASAAVVEYGYYCNHPLMVQMAEKLGATQMLSENFSQYEPIFESAMTKKVMGAKKIEIEVGSALHGFAYAMQDNEIISYAVDNRRVLVPEGLADLYWFAELPVSAGFEPARTVMLEASRAKNEQAIRALYAGLVPLTQRMLSNDIFKVLRALGDVRLIRQFSQCFGKQAYVDFQNTVMEAVVDQTKRFVQGYNPDEVPPDDAYTIIDLLYDLQADDENLFYPSHEAFNYQRIGRKAVESTSITDADAARVAEIATKLTETRDPKEIQQLQQELSGLAQSRPSLQFVPDHEHAGYPLSSLVLNEDRPNISAQVKIPGTIDLTEIAGDFAASQGNPFTTDIRTLSFPVKFPTHIHRNYTIVRDGIRNAKVLPVSLTKETYRKLSNAGLFSDQLHPTWKSDHIYLLDLMKLPLINRKMVKTVSANDLFYRHFDLLKAKAAQKVFNHYFGEYFPPEATKGLADRYGDEAAKWLAELGIKDYGYSPKVELTEPTESYYGKELKVSVKGVSSLPSVKEVLDKLDAGKKLTTREAMLGPVIAEVKGLVTSPAYTSVNKGAQDSLLRVWLTSRKKDTTAQVRKVMRELSEIKFSIIVGQVWFLEFSSLDENRLDMTFDGATVTCTANLNEVEIKV